MTTHLKLRIHISEPWDFERTTGLTELAGGTVDHADEENADWEVMLDHELEYHERNIDRVLISPRYVGEHLSRIFDAVVGFPIRIAHRRDGGWHYAMTGMLSVRREDDSPDTPEEKAQ